MEALGKFVQYIRYEKNFSSHTVLAYTHDLEEFAAYVQEYFETTSPSEMDADMVRSWMVHLLESGVSGRSVHRKLSALKSFWRFLLREGVVTANPVRTVTAPKLRKPLPSYLKKGEMEAVHEADSRPACGEAEESREFETCRDNLIMEMFLQTGMRRAELVALKLSDVDMSSSLLRVTGKRNRQRLIPFGPSLREMIDGYLSVRMEFSAGEDGPSSPFYIRRGGQGLYPTLVYRLVRGRLESVGHSAKSSPHVLRHTFATTLLNNGAELNAVKELLGHASLSATEVYTHTSFEELKKIYGKAHPRAGEQ